MMFSPVMLLDQLAGDAADAAQLAVAVGVRFAALDDVAADHGRALGDGHDGIVAGVVPLVFDQQRGQACSMSNGTSEMIARSTWAR